MWPGQRMSLQVEVRRLWRQREPRFAKFRYRRSCSESARPSRTSWCSAPAPTAACWCWMA
eukprot:4143579-Prorocentrum_lima.AAC.1